MTTWYVHEQTQSGPVVIGRWDWFSDAKDEAIKWMGFAGHTGVKLTVSYNKDGTDISGGGALLERTDCGYTCLFADGRTENTDFDWGPANKERYARHQQKLAEDWVDELERYRFECFNVSDRTQVYARFTQLSLAKFYQRKDSPRDANGKLCQIRWADPLNVGKIVYNPAHVDGEKRFYLVLESVQHLPEYHTCEPIYDEGEARDRAVHIIRRPFMYGDRGPMTIYRQDDNVPPVRVGSYDPKQYPPIIPRRNIRRSVS